METPSLNPQPDADSEHLKLLSIFHYVVYGMAASPALCGLLAPLKRTVVGALLILCWSVAAFGAEVDPKNWTTS